MHSYILKSEKQLTALTCVHAQSLSRVQLCVTPWTVAHQAPLSMGFPRQESWSGLPCPSPGALTLWLGIIYYTTEQVCSHHNSTCIRSNDQLLMPSKKNASGRKHQIWVPLPSFSKYQYAANRAPSGPRPLSPPLWFCCKSKTNTFYFLFSFYQWKISSTSFLTILLDFYFDNSIFNLLKCSSQSEGLPWWLKQERICL